MPRRRVARPLGVLAPRRLPYRLRSPPESLECPPVGRLPQLLERPLTYLPDALARDSHQRPDLLERHRFAAFLEPVVEVEDLALARREIFLEDAVDELAHQLAVGLFLDLAAFLTGEALAQGGGVLVATVDGGVERQLGGRHAARGAHVLSRVLERERDLVVGGLAAELLRQVSLGAAHPDELGVLIQRDADAPGLLRESLEDGLAHPPYGVRDELHALIRIELLDRFEESFIADGDQLGEIQTVTLILLDVGDDESEVGSDEALSGFFVTPLHAPGEPALLRGIFDQGELLNVLQVLVEGTGRIGAEKRLRLASVRPCHS